MKYRKISPCIWNDAKVRELSDKGKLALLFLLTHPHMTPLGAIRANAPGLACELGWSEKVFRKAFGGVLALGIAKEDDATRYLRMGKRQTVARINLISAFLAVLVFAFAILVIYALFFRLHNHMSLANQWSPGVLATANLEEGYGSLYPAPIVIRTFSPIGAVMLEMLFLILYSFFLAVVSMTVNALFKQSIGSIICIFSVMVVALFGARNYQEFSFYPFYNGHFKALTEINNFTFVNYAILYWAAALTLAITIYCLVMRKVDLISLSREK